MTETAIKKGELYITEQCDKLFTSLIQAQMAITGVKKKGKNPHYGSKFAKYEDVIDEILPPLNKNGIALLHITTPSGLVTMLGHESGQYIGGALPLEVLLQYKQRGTGKMDKYGKEIMEIIPGTGEKTPQAMCSAVTYNQRYGAKAIVALKTYDDDDGEAAMGRGKKPDPKPDNKAGDKPPVITPSYTKTNGNGTNYSNIRHDDI